MKVFNAASDELRSQSSEKEIEMMRKKETLIKNVQTNPLKEQAEKGGPPRRQFRSFHSKCSHSGCFLSRNKMHEWEQNDARRETVPEPSRRLERAVT
jgi:hypothetical protein